MKNSSLSNNHSLSQANNTNAVGSPATLSPSQVPRAKLIFDSEYEKSRERYKEHVDFFVNDVHIHIKKVQTLLNKVQLYVKDAKYENPSNQIECQRIFESLKNNIKMMQDDSKYAENEIRNLRISSALEKKDRIRNAIPRRGYIVD